MRASKWGHLDMPRRQPRLVRGRWYDLREFLELKDLEDSERRAPRPPRHFDPLASASDYIPHTLGCPVDDDDEA